MRLDFETKMKLAQTNLQSSRRDSLKIARCFNAGIRLVCASSPAGTAEPARPFRPSLPSPLRFRLHRISARRVAATSRDLNPFAAQPGVKTPGYSHPSLRDKTPAQTTLSKLRRSDLFVENQSAPAFAALRRGRQSIFNFVSRADVAPTELENFSGAVATKIPRLRRWEMPQTDLRGSVQGGVAVAPASWSAPVLWRFDHGGQKRQRAAALQNLAEFSTLTGR